MKLPYSQKVIEYFEHPVNVGEIPDADTVVTEGSPACGDMIKLFLKVNKETSIIEDIKFKSYGCASNIATASVMTELAKGKTLDEAGKIEWKDADRILEGLPQVKIHCAVLAMDALHRAIEDYRMQNGLLKEKVKTDLRVIKKRLAHVVNPINGKSILADGYVEKIEVIKEEAAVHLNLKSTHQFAGNIKEEIKERLEVLWDIKGVRVTFSDSSSSN